MDKLSHIDDRGEAVMVDVSGKEITAREAVATGFIRLQPTTLSAIAEGSVQKGNVFATAKVAGIMAAKNTAFSIPMCHNISLSHVEVTLATEDYGVRCTSRIRCMANTGAEMEALSAVSTALLTIYDMVKAIDKQMVIEGICLLEKSGGRSGHFKAGE